MTINKIGLSIATLAVLSASSLYAAATNHSTTVKTDSGVIAAELLYDNNVSLANNTDLNVSFRPKLTAGIQRGKVSIELDGLSNVKITPTASLWNKDTNKTVSSKFSYAGVNHQKIVFDINDTINDADTIYLVKDSDLSNVVKSVEMNATMLSNATSVTFSEALLDNTDKLLSNGTKANMITTQKEWSVEVSSFSGQIDAAQGFLKFNPNTATDTSSVTLTANTTGIVQKTGIVVFETVAKADNNVSAFGSYTVGGVAKTIANNQYDYNTTTNADTTKIDNITFTADGKNKIQETIWNADVKLVKVGDVTLKTPKTLYSGSFGQWTIYGYNAQIPDVMPTDDFVTYLKFINRSNTPSDVFFTLIDQDGRVVTLDSINDDIASLPVGIAQKYKASDLAAIASKENPDFDMTHSISIEVSIPTTPSSVYGMASLKNKALGQFKVLPIYNNGNNY